MKTGRYDNDIKNIEPTKEVTAQLMERLNNEVFSMNDNDDNVIVFDNNPKSKASLVFKIAAAVVIVVSASLISVKLLSDDNSVKNNRSQVAASITNSPAIAKQPEATEVNEEPGTTSSDIATDSTCYTKCDFDKEYTIDFDNDKVEETKMTCSKKNDNGVDVLIMKLGDKTFTSDDGSLKILSEYTDMKDYYYVADINKTDNTKEIVFIMNQTKNSPFSFFFNYDFKRQEISLMGTTYGTFTDYTFNNDGTFEAKVPMSILQKWYKEYNEKLPPYLTENWYGIQKTKITNGLLETVEQKIMDTDTIYLNLKETTTMYSEAVVTSTKRKIPAQPVSLNGTDDANFVRIQLEDESIAYLYTNDNGTLENGEYPSDIFEMQR